MAVKSKKLLNAKNNADIVSYAINTNPDLMQDIDLPVQGMSPKEIGKLVLDCERHKNAFVNTLNLIATTVMVRATISDRWMFAEAETINWGEAVRETFTDLVDVYDYNKKVDDVTFFLQNFVPDIYTYIHEINYQKFYAISTSDQELAMAFHTDDGLFNFIDSIISRNWDSYKLDMFQLKKYIIARRVIDGTMTPVTIEDVDDARKQAAKIIETADTMGFPRNDYNPIGAIQELQLPDMVLIINSKYRSRFDTETLAMSFNKEYVENKQGLVVSVDNFGYFEEDRLKRFIGLEPDAELFTLEERKILESIPAVIIARNWFRFFKYQLNITDDAEPEKVTMFENPTTLRANHFLHAWGIASSSPYLPCCVFTFEDGVVTGVTISPATATIAVGSELTLTHTTETEGVINKAVRWEVSDTEVATITQGGKLKAKTTGEVTVTATSIANPSISGTATITIQ